MIGTVPFELNRLILVVVVRERFVALESEYAQKGSDLGEVALDWDKDDVDALRFVCAASNLRSRAFGIPTKSLFDVKSIAGKQVTGPE